MVLNRQGEPQISIPVIETPNIAAYWYPTHFSFGPGDAITVINRDGALEEGELVTVKQNKGVIRKISLPLGTWPENVVVRQNDFLVTDIEGMRILRISHNGTLHGNFGEGAFQTALSTGLAKRDRFQMIQKSSQQGLILLVCLLFVAFAFDQGIIFIKQKKDYLKDNLQPPWLDIQYVPIDSMTVKRKVAFVTGTIAFVIMAESFMIFSPYHPIGEFVSVIILMAFFVGIFFPAAWATRAGLYRKSQIQRIRNFLRRHQTVLGQVLMSGEKVWLYTLANQRQGKLTTFRRPMIGVHTIFLVVTTHRILLLGTDIIGGCLRSIWEVSFHGIHEVSLEVASRWDRLFFKWFGSGWLSFRLREADWGIGFQIPFLPDQAEVIRQAIEAGQAASLVTFVGIRRICVHCFSSITPPETICPGCHHKIPSPSRAATLSMLYPGLGQLANQGLLKGILFLVISTPTLLILLRNLLTWYRGSAEVSPRTLLTLLVVFVAIWISSVVDAYYTAKRF
jgi:hypothetical protein